MDSKWVNRSLEHEFILKACQNELEGCTDLVKLRQMCMTLVQLVETQKQVFECLLCDALELASENPYRK